MQLASVALTLLIDLHLEPHVI